MKRCDKCGSTSNFDCCMSNEKLSQLNDPSTDFDIRNIAKNIMEKNKALLNRLVDTRKMTLPTDSKERKEYPILSGCLKYFPAAIAGVAHISKQGNDKHNPGEEMHHARGKSMDHGDCILRHLIDTEDLLAKWNSGEKVSEELLVEVNQMVWRALAYSQLIHEKLGAPMAPGAKNV